MKFPSLLALLVLPSLVHAQSFHYLFTFPEYDSSEVYGSSITSKQSLNNGSVGLINAVAQDFYTDITVMLADINGEVSDTYYFDDQFSTDIPTLMTASNGDPFLTYLSDFYYVGNQAHWTQFSYELDGGLQQIFHYDITLPDNTPWDIRNGINGVRIISEDDDAAFWVSGVDTAGDESWTYAAQFGDFSIAPQVAFNDTHSMFWFFSSSSSGLPLDFVLVNQAGSQVLRKRLSSSSLNSSLPGSSLTLSDTNVVLFDDNSSLVMMDLFDDDEFEFYLVLLYLDSSGDQIWSMLMDPFLNIPNIRDSSEVSWTKGNNGLLAYVDNFGSVGIFNGALGKFRMFEGFIDATNTIYRPFIFENGDLGINSASINEPTDRQTANFEFAYMVFDSAFTPKLYGSWFSEFSYYHAPRMMPAFEELIISSSYNQFSVLHAGSSEEMVSAGFVSFESNVVNTAVDLDILDINPTPGFRSLTSGNLAVTALNLPPLVPDSMPLVSSVALAQSEQAISSPTVADIHYSNIQDGVDSWESTYFGYPWFEYKVRQSDDLSNWSEITQLQRYGFQAIVDEDVLASQGALFEQVTLTVPAK